MPTLHYLQTHLVDVILAVILLGFAVNGFRSGLVVALGQLCGAVAGFWIARTWSGWLGAILHGLIPGRSGIMQFIAFVTIFLLVDRLVGLLFWLADKALKILTILPFLSTIHSILGAIVGFAEGLLLIGSSSYIVLTLRLDPLLLTWIGRSAIAPVAQTFFYRVLGRFL